MNNRQRWSCQVDKHTAEEYKQYFRENDIYFEPSEFYDLVHISFDVSEEELKALDCWIRKELFR
jgi:hypothetical protein